jgi:hypothetical protein
MNKLFSILMLSMLTFNLVAQQFEVPKNYVLKEKSDYPKYENDIIKGIDWLLQTPINAQAEKRKEVNRFLIMWLTGSPDVSIEIKSEIVNFTNLNPDLLMVFLGGWTKYALENNYSKNKIMGNQKGIEAVIDFYQKNKNDLKKDKQVEKYIKLKDKGKLEEHIAKTAA